MFIWIALNDWLLYPPNHCKCERIQWNIYVLNIQDANNIEWLQYWIVGVSITVSFHALYSLFYMDKVVLFVSSTRSFFVSLSPYLFAPLSLFLPFLFSEKLQELFA